MKRLPSLREGWRALGRRARVTVAACVVMAAGLFISQLIEIPVRSAMRGLDNTYNYFWLRSLMVDGDWDFRNDIEENNTLTAEYRQIARDLAPTEAGRVPNKYGVGWALVSLPGYLVADVLVYAGRAAGVWTYSNDGYNAVYQVCLQTWHFFLAGVSLFLAYRVVRRWCGHEESVTGVALLWAASPLLYYQTSNLSMSHGVAFLALVLCVYALQLARAAPARLSLWCLAGAGMGLAAITRYQTAIFGLLPLWAVVAQARVSRDPALIGRIVLAGAAGALPLIALQMVAWKVVYGSWLVYSYGAEAEPFYWTNPAFAEVLFSPNHGLFYWHPLLLAGLAGLLALAWKQGGLPWAGVAAVAIGIYVNAAWWCWWFGASFGGRAFEGAFLFFMAGLAWWFGRLRERAARWLFAGCTVLVLWNVVWLLLYRLALVPRNGPVTYGDVWSALGKLMW